MRYRFILITLSHIELNNRKKIFPNKLTVLNFFKSYFLNITNIIYCIVSEETHEDGNYHYHVGLKTTGITNRYFFKDLRLKLSEFDGRSFDIQFKKGFNTIAHYLLKEDKSPALFGITFDELKNLANATYKKKSSEYLIERLREKESWEDVLNDPEFSQKLLHNYTSLKKLYDTLNLKNQTYTSVIERYNNGLLTKELDPKQKESLKKYIDKMPQNEKDVLIWTLNNIFKKRNFRQDQLLIIGESQTGKSTFIRKLIEDLNLKVYEASSDDFSQYSDKSYDLILLDEFNYKNFNRSFLLKLLDGSALNYTGKFKEFNIKRDNMPVILICNPTALPDLNDRHWNALQKRLVIINFKEEKKKHEKITKHSFLDILSLMEKITSKDLAINVFNINLYENKHNN